MKLYHVQTPRTCCWNTRRMLSEHPEQVVRSPRTDGARCASSSHQAGARIRCSGSSDNIFKVFGQHVLEARTTRDGCWDNIYLFRFFDFPSKYINIFTYIHTYQIDIFLIYNIIHIKLKYKVLIYSISV